MIIKRITETLVSQQWKDLTVELLVVIVGVFLAFQVESWNESRKELAQEKLLLESLRDDFAQNREVGERRIGQYAQAEAAALRLRGIIETETTVNAQEFYSLINDANSVWPPSFIGGTWDLLTADGQLTVIKNASIKKEIAEFYEDAAGFDYFFDGVTLVRRAIEQHIDDHYGLGRWFYHLHPEDLEGLGFEENDRVELTVASRRELNGLCMRAWHAALDFRINLERITENAREIEESITGELGRFD